MMLAYPFIGFVNSDYVHQGDQINYVSITGIDYVSCFNEIDNPCQSFIYVFVNINANCVIIQSIPFHKL